MPDAFVFFLLNMAVHFHTIYQHLSNNLWCSCFIRTLSISTQPVSTGCQRSLALGRLYHTIPKLLLICYLKSLWTWSARLSASKSNLFRCSVAVFKVLFTQYTAIGEFTLAFSWKSTFKHRDRVHLLMCGFKVC